MKGHFSGSVNFLSFGNSQSIDFRRHVQKELNVVVWYPQSPSENTIYHSVGSAFCVSIEFLSTVADLRSIDFNSVEHIIFLRNTLGTKIRYSLHSQIYDV